MSRVVFPKNEQRLWFEKLLKDNLGIKISDLAKVCSVSSRTIRDWRREKFTIKQESLIILCEKFGLPIPDNVQIVDDYWYGVKGAKNGGLRHVQLYGPPGNHESRVKGGLVSQKRRRDSPEKYINCVLPKIFPFPNKNNVLAELIGIILGDGNISHNQLKITLDRTKEENYRNYVSDMINLIFNERPTVHLPEGKNSNVCNLILTGVNLIKILNSLGVTARNKVLQQASVPVWICQNQSFSSACMKGLVDTDGGLYVQQKLAEGNFNVGFCFSNKSKPLLDFVHKTLINLGYTARRRENAVYMYRESEVIKYASEVGFGNKHHQARLSDYLSSKNSWRSSQVAHGDCLESN